MTTVSRRHWALTTLAFLTALPVAVPGCRKGDDGVKVQTLEGTIEEIRVDPDGNGEITVLYFSEKHGQDIVGIGLVTNETEILINGVVSSLSDIRQGERVRGEVRVEKKNGEKVQTALKIYVDRPRPVGGK